jgi:hypothetical protein
MPATGSFSYPRVQVNGFDRIAESARPCYASRPYPAASPIPERNAGTLYLLCLTEAETSQMAALRRPPPADHTRAAPSSNAFRRQHDAESLSGNPEGRSLKVFSGANIASR